MQYGDIVKAALAYSDKSDALDVQNNVDVFLRVVESRANRGLQIRQQSKRARLTCDPMVEYYGLPVDFSGLRDVEILHGNNRITMRYLAPEAMNRHVNENGSTASYSLVSNQIRVWPKMDSSHTIEVIYYQRVMPLSNDEPSNWMADRFPDVYIFGLCVEIAAFTKDADSATLWDQRFRDALQAMTLDDARDLWSGPSPSIQIL